MSPPLTWTLPSPVPRQTGEHNRLGPALRDLRAPRANPEVRCDSLSAPPLHPVRVVLSLNMSSLSAAVARGAARAIDGACLVVTGTTPGVEFGIDGFSRLSAPGASRVS